MLQVFKFEEVVIVFFSLLSLKCNGYVCVDMFKDYFKNFVDFSNHEFQDLPVRQIQTYQNMTPQLSLVIKLKEFFEKVTHLGSLNYAGNRRNTQTL